MRDSSIYMGMVSAGPLWAVILHHFSAFQRHAWFSVAMHSCHLLFIHKHIGCFLSSSAAVVVYLTSEIGAQLTKLCKAADQRRVWCQIVCLGILNRLEVVLQRYGPERDASFDLKFIDVAAHIILSSTSWAI